MKSITISPDTWDRLQKLREDGQEYEMRLLISTLRSDPKFCTKCGRRLVIEAYSRRYDAQSGNPVWKLGLDCPRWFFRSHTRVNSEMPSYVVQKLVYEEQVEHVVT